MRINSAPIKELLWAAIAMVILPSYARTAFAQNNSHSQVMILPDPTPRQRDPHLLYQQETPNRPAPTKRDLAVQSEKRRQLVAWAANELVTLSDRAEKAAAASPGNTSKAELTVDVTKIETLSKTLAAALKTQ